MVLSLKVVSIGFDLDRQLLLLVPGVFEFFGYAFNNFSWLLTAIRAYVLSIGSLLYSTCFSNWIIIDGSYKWLIAFRDAQSFRFSHYFTCYTSEATAIASGIGASRYREAGNSETKW
uniref:7TM_GPCR_Srx domain-containing protein n=1 Tax=Macrostomum lignano TaxID=282301 RepID=A0A1I8IE06_9PLAT